MDVGPLGGDEAAMEETERRYAALTNYRKQRDEMASWKNCSAGNGGGSDAWGDGVGPGGGGTLGSLAEELAGLAARVERIESVWEGPGAIEVDGGCVIGMPDQLQDETVMKYKDQFDEWLDTNSIWPIEIRHDSDSGHTVIVYADDIGMFADYFVAESWDGCEFAGSTDWYEEE